MVQLTGTTIAVGIPRTDDDKRDISRQGRCFKAVTGQCMENMKPQLYRKLSYNLDHLERNIIQHFTEGRITQSSSNAISNVAYSSKRRPSEESDDRYTCTHLYTIIT